MEESEAKKVITDGVGDDGIEDGGSTNMAQDSHLQLPDGEESLNVSKH